MASDYNLPGLTDLYTNVLPYLKDRDVDAITLCKANPSNPPTGTMKWNRSTSVFQEYNAGFADVLLALAGGGTGAATAVNARTNLGLGTMAVQNSSAVNISGGTLIGNGAGLTALAAGNISTGTVGTARLGSGVANGSSYLRGDQTWATIPAVDIIYGADQSANFTAVINTFYNLITNSRTCTLPTVVGNAGKFVGLILKSSGISWVLDPNGTETILGALTYTFDWGQYACIVLKADANGGKWDIV